MLNSAVPVVMYHSIGIVNANWIWPLLTCPWELFQQQLEILKNKNFHTISLHQLYDHKKKGTKLPPNSIILTFDDGYLDNWVFAYPLLKKYGFTGTIFVNPEFVESRDIIRKNLENVWLGNESFEKIETKGFLSWEELKLMEAKGVMDIQSHTMTHTWHFCGDEIIDFHHPGNIDYPWLFWNKHPERKSFYLKENQETFISYGTPIYKHGRSLGVRRYFPDEDFDQFIVDFVNKQGEHFFEQKNWRTKLFREAEDYKSKKVIRGRYESDDEQKKRFEYELIECKKILEDKLNKKVDYLCWAGDAHNDDAIKIAKRAGYLSSTLFFGDVERKNIYGEDPSEINRIGCSSACYWRKNFISYTDANFFLASLKYFQGNKMYHWIRKLYKLKYRSNFIVKNFFRGKTLNESEID